MKHTEALLEIWTAIAAECPDACMALCLLGCVADLRAALSADAKISTCTTNIDE